QLAEMLATNANPELQSGVESQEGADSPVMSRPMRQKLILNKGVEEQVHEFEEIEQAFDAAVPWIMKGYIARVTDKHGAVKYTQALVNGQITTYNGDSTERQVARQEPGANTMATFNCPQCGGPLNEMALSDRRCQSCGAVLPDEAAGQPGSAEEVPQG